MGEVQFKLVAPFGVERVTCRIFEVPPRREKERAPVSGAKIYERISLQVGRQSRKRPVENLVGDLIDQQGRSFAEQKLFGPVVKDMPVREAQKGKIATPPVAKPHPPCHARCSSEACLRHSHPGRAGSPDESTYSLRG